MGKAIRLPTDRSVCHASFYCRNHSSAIGVRKVIIPTFRPGKLCTRGARSNLRLIPMSTDLTNIPPDFQVLATGINGPDGPAIGPDGQLYLVSAVDAVIIRVSTDGEITRVAETEGRPNGLVFNAAGEMLVAGADTSAVMRVDKNGGRETVGDHC